MAHYLELDSAFTSILLYDRGEIINKSVMQAEVFNAFSYSSRRNRSRVKKIRRSISRTPHGEQIFNFVISVVSWKFVAVAAADREARL